MKDENEYGRVSDPLTFLKWIVDNGYRDMASAVVSNIGCYDLQLLSKKAEAGQGIPGFAPRDAAFSTAK